jgi:hypothetical protein
MRFANLAVRFAVQTEAGALEVERISARRFSPSGGLGRHHAGSNFFWYLKDPAGNFSEYYADMDCIIDDQLWTPEALEGAKGLFNWGPPPPPSFLAPDDLAAMMTGNHSMR